MPVSVSFLVDTAGLDRCDNANMKQIAGLETDGLMSDDVVLASQRC